MALIHEEEPSISFYFKRFYYIQVMEENFQSNFITDFGIISSMSSIVPFLFFIRKCIPTSIQSSPWPWNLFWCCAIQKVGLDSLVEVIKDQHQKSRDFVNLFFQNHLWCDARCWCHHTASSVHITISWKFYTSRSQLLIHFWESTSQIWFRRKGLSNFFEAY